MYKKNSENRVKAFTLLEVLIVLVVISILLLVGLPSLTKFTKSAKKRADELNMLTIKEAAALYLVENTADKVDTKTLIEKGYLDVKKLSKGSTTNPGQELISPLTNKAYTITVNPPTNNSDDKAYIVVSNGEETTSTGAQGN